MRHLNRTYFQKLYTVDIEDLSEEYMDDFLLCGNRNWQYYFTDISKLPEEYRADATIINNIYFIEFDTQNNLSSYINKKDSHKIENICTENSFYSLLLYK